MRFSKPDILKLKAERNVYGLINVLKDSNSNVRAVAVQALGEIKDEVASEFLIEALRDTDWSVRRNAVWALGEIGTKRAIPHLIHALGEVYGGIEAYAAEALVKIGRASITPLVRALTSQNLSIRYWSTDVLGELGDARAVEPLIRMLGDNDAIIRCSAIKSLGEIGDTRALKPLTVSLNDSSDLVKRFAARSLGKLKEIDDQDITEHKRDKLLALIAVFERKDGSIAQVRVNVSDDFLKRATVVER
jgi:HEAT repeat protein